MSALTEPSRAVVGKHNPLADWLGHGTGLTLACAPMSELPIVDVKSNTVTHAGHTMVMRPLSDDAFTVLIEGEPVGRVVYTFGAAMAVAESDKVTEDELTAVAEAWFAALEG